MGKLPGEERKPSHSNKVHREWLVQSQGFLEDSVGHTLKLSPGGIKDAAAFIYTYMSVFGLELSLGWGEWIPKCF